MKRIKIISLLFFSLQIFAAYIFTRGFFLIKEQLPLRSEANPLDNSEVWYEKKAKVIFLIVDALRFDFFYFNETLPEQEQHTFQNKFVKLHNHVKANPENFVSFKAYADPPTVTVHRVQAMITGNLPPFVEITENFGSSVVILSIFF